jgi:NADH:ubiquinone oxidoreductase subunit 3 (subunit A)
MHGIAAALAIFFVTLVGFLILRASERHIAPSKSTAPARVPFTGGRTPDTHAWNRYHVRYYPMSLLFLAFDMEMVFMYPWTLVVRSVGVSAVVEMFGFLLVLLAGVVYAWREGALRWT